MKWKNCKYLSLMKINNYNTTINNLSQLPWWVQIEKLTIYKWYLEKKNGEKKMKNSVQLIIKLISKKTLQIK